MERQVCIDHCISQNLDLHIAWSSCWTIVDKYTHAGSLQVLCPYCDNQSTAHNLMNMELEQMGGICSIGQCYLKEQNEWWREMAYNNNKAFQVIFFFWTTSNHFIVGHLLNNFMHLQLLLSSSATQSPRFGSKIPLPQLPTWIVRFL